MPKQPEPTPWDGFKSKMAALGIDPLKPFVGEDDPRFEDLQTILAEFGGNGPVAAIAAELGRASARGLRWHR